MQRIGVFDSGIGGLTTLAEIKCLLGGGDFVFFADNKRSPFGLKSQEELFDIGCDGVKTLLSLGCDIIVLGCNTLTATTKPKLMERFKGVNIVGTEPAVKPAINECCKVALLATPASIASDRVQNLLLECRGQVTCFPQSNLAGIIEKIAPDYDIMYDYVSSAYRFLSDYDGLVLGCTHFVHVKHVFQECFKNLKIFDGNYGVAKRVKSFINCEIKNERVKIYLTQKDEEERYYKIFDNFCKNLKMGIEK